jgi:hypothetical protein
MNLSKPFLVVLLVSGLLLSCAAGATEPVQRSTDEKGTIRIATPTKKDQAGEPSGAAQASPEAAKAGKASEPETPPPGLLPSHSRRYRGGAAAEAARRKAFEKSHPDLVKPAGESQPTPEPGVPPRRLAPPPPSPTVNPPAAK